VKFIEDILGTVRFDKCFNDAQLLSLRNRVNSKLTELARLTERAFYTIRHQYYN